MSHIKNPTRLKRRLSRFGRSLLCLILAGTFVLDPSLIQRRLVQAQEKPFPDSAEARQQKIKGLGTVHRIPQIRR